MKKNEKVKVQIKVYLPKYQETYSSYVADFTLDECAKMLEKAKDATEAITLPMVGKTIVIPPDLVKEAVITFDGLEITVEDDDL